MAQMYQTQASVNSRSAARVGLNTQLVACSVKHRAFPRDEKSYKLLNSLDINVNRHSSIERCSNRARIIPRRPSMTRFQTSNLSARRLALAALGALSIATGLPAWSQTASPQAVKIGPVTFEPEVTVGGQKLVLNGAGMRIRAIFNVYAAGLYAPRKVTKNEDVLKTDLPKRIHLVSQRDLRGDEFGSLFAKAMENNASREEFAKSVNSVMKMGQVFAEARDFKKGDVILVDYTPARGIVISHKGKQMGEPFVGNEFHTLMFKIWFGPKPVDEALRKALLGEQSTANANVN
jgi:hypothetical protein